MSLSIQTLWRRIFGTREPARATHRLGLGGGDQALPLITARDHIWPREPSAHVAREHMAGESLGEWVMLQYLSR